ncbi:MULTISPECIES: CBS domain-containing protein [Saccharothrix]|uniref:CBS domain protein n=1 Tax=Saccharothrix variisporea TaxID=543527 RepID=A0A495XQJ9_9PSEU|nr:CBS domain-containing protein [Saccharothrix variisporea]NUT95137.1 CBS domain-containing protein [Saccharothrix sp.]RKT73928.1 CBS domain protein [Saccharothrix variisporea]
MTTAREIMNAGVQCIKEDQSLLDAARMMRDLNVGSLPICGRDDRLHGIITDRDIVVRCVAEGRSCEEMKAGELSGHLHWVDADDDISHVLRQMEEHQIRRMPVIEEHRLVGMVSEADIARHLTEDQIAEFVERVYAR